MFQRVGQPLGRRGERVAAKWLAQRGYRVLHRNFTIVDDEADLVTLDPDGRTVVIVEVKTRRADVTAPEHAATRRKQFNLARLASRLQRAPEYRNHPMRFDLIAVVMPIDGEPVIRHVPGAFESPW
jgi:putative endonuclease